MRRHRIIFFVSLIIYLFVFLWLQFPITKSSSDDGAWTAYLIPTSAKGNNIADGICVGVLIYNGNINGNVGNINIVSKLNYEKERTIEEVPQSKEMLKSHSLTFIENRLISKPYFYWFYEAGSLAGTDMILMNIRWIENEISYESKVELNVLDIKKKSLIYQLVE